MWVGLKKIQFSCLDDETQVYTKITTEFPKLQSCGGVELLRSMSNCRMLQVIDGKWDVETLKSSVGSQCNIYIRPIQKSISVEIDTEESKNQIQEMCYICLKNICLVDLRHHIEECGLMNPVHCLEECQDNSTCVAVTEPVTVTVLNMHHESIDYVPNMVYDSETFYQTDENIIPALDLQNENVVIQSDDNNSSTLDLQTRSINSIVAFAVEELVSKKIDNPVEMLRFLQSVVVTGRKLDIDSSTDSIDGETNFINIDRQNILETAMDEIKAIANPRLTLEVQFYGEVSLYIIEVVKYEQSWLIFVSYLMLCVVVLSLM
ncbi:hypothetical protein DPMN_133552 [Dreissena polymorpha]|uniref:Uncharacterized protein n=1 Tax=Dreissena polymorpha TaxID=45954 RepID=A0A9D4FUH5_DREPO|nr:hypothetical protein DPMN_133552 [Dreissena polymorpha]